MIRLPVTCLLLGILSCAGCSVVFYTVQPVELTVSHRATGAATAGARVALVPVKGYSSRQTPNEWMDNYLKTMNVGSYPTSRPTNAGMTDGNGDVSIAADTSVVIGGGWFNFAKPLDDRLSGTEYFVRIRTPATAEVVHVQMEPGHQVQGQAFIVDVIKIGEAHDLRAASK